MRWRFLVPAVLMFTGLTCGCAIGARPTEGFIEMRLANDEPQEGFTPKVIFETGKKLYVSPDIEVNEHDIKDAEVLKTHRSHAVGVHLTRGATSRLNRLVKNRLPGDKLAILVADRVVSAPYIKTEIGRQMLIMGNFTRQEAEELAAILRGERMPSMPAPRR